MDKPDSHRLLIARDDLHRTQWRPDPDATRPLEPGQARLVVEQVALTANNITYAAFGEAMKYWQFFPAPEPGWGCLPTWGFATVAESRAEGLAPGRRLWGYLPLGTHLVVQPGRLRASGFMDQSPHRAELAAAYQAYAFCDADPAWRPALEGLQAVLKPLFMTAFLLDDFLADEGFFGARRLLLSSASSKTAYATAFCLARRAREARPEIVGLTSDGRRGFVQGLGCFDRVLGYGELETLPADEAAVYVDFAGDAGLRRRVHGHWGDRLAFSSAIGGTHWRELGGGGGLPGPRPTLFFAPGQAKKRSAPPPDGWGPEGFATRLGEGWQTFLAAVQREGEGGREPWVRIVTHEGTAAAEAGYRALLDGSADAREGLMLRLR